MGGIVTRRTRFTNPPPSASPEPSTEHNTTSTASTSQDNKTIASDADVYEFKDESDEEETERPRPLHIKSPQGSSLEGKTAHEVKSPNDVKALHETKVTSPQDSKVTQETKLAAEIKTPDTKPQQDSIVKKSIDVKPAANDSKLPEIKITPDTKSPHEAPKATADLNSPDPTKLTVDSKPCEVKSAPQEPLKSPLGDVLKSPHEVLSEARTPPPSPLSSISHVTSSASTRKSRRLQVSILFSIPVENILPIWITNFLAQVFFLLEWFERTLYL